MHAISQEFSAAEINVFVAIEMGIKECFFK
jgi:hypothetical protein